MLPTRILPLLVSLLLLLAACGSPDKSADAGLDKDLWKEFRGGAQLDPAESAELREKLSEVQSLGYFDGVKPADGAESSVTHVDPELAWPGYNLIVSGGQPEAVLMDMLGHPLHRWHLDLEAAWTAEDLDRDPELKALLAQPGDGVDRKDSWQRVRLLPGGELLALFKDVGLVRIDKDSNLIWKRTFAAHHDMVVASNGDILVLISEPRVLPRIDPQAPQLDDLVLVLSPEGEEKQRFSIYDALENSPFADLLTRCKPSGDPFHTNSIQILEILPLADPPLPGAFKPGAFLLSIREIDTIAVLDPETGAITWAKSGPWKAQHHATMLPGGTITIFDNYGDPDPEHGESRVVEYNPTDDRIVWEYAGNARNELNSRRRGNVQRLPNGNTLINESDNGRAFEVTQDGRIVWEYINPSRAGEGLRYIAVIRSLDRIDPQSLSHWLKLE